MGSESSGSERDKSEFSDDDGLEESLYYDGVSSARLPFRKHVSEAQWDAEKGMAEVVVRKGKLWNTTGVMRSSLLLAHVEEAAFMVEQGSLIMREGEQREVMSLLDTYSLLASNAYGCSWAAYQAYSYLKKLGYIVGRHNVPWTVSSKNRVPVAASLEISDLQDLEGRLGETNLIEIPQLGDNSCDETCQDSMRLTNFEFDSAAGGRQPSLQDDNGRGDVGAFSASGEQLLLQVSPTISMQNGHGPQSRNGYNPHARDNDQDMRVMFDVHRPNGGFKKTSPGEPDFCLCVTSNCPPDRVEVRALEHACVGRPVKFASVECGHVTIFSFDAVELPTLP